jgi:hypothetical protein
MSLVPVSDTRKGAQMKRTLCTQIERQQARFARDTRKALLHARRTYESVALKNRSKPQ